jgi:hypothetical protein
MAEAAEQALIDEGALPPDDFHDAIERIGEVAEYDVELPTDLSKRLEDAVQDLLVAPELLQAGAAALATGHLVIQGPPGTGKSSLARALASAFGASVMPVTAHEDWTTFEVIGRQELQVNSDGREEIVPMNGFFTEAAIRCAGAVVRHFDNPDEPQAVWLLIDELNRAHLDKAFGELFSVLGTDDRVPTTLGFQREGNRELITPARFRILATLNSVDKQFVNSLSQGLKRRFTFITMDIPPPKRSDEAYGNLGKGASTGSREFTVVIQRAGARVARRLNRPGVDLKLVKQQLIDELMGGARDTVTALFDLAAQTRYAKRESGTPFLPVGTAQLIDTVELFLTRVRMQSADASQYGQLMDWAASVKLAPLFDADTITENDLKSFAEKLGSPFDNWTKRELMQIVAAGSYFVDG